MPPRICLGKVCVWARWTLLTGVLWGALGERVGAQVAWQDESFPYRRTVQLPDTAGQASIVVADFFAHGQLPSTSSPLAVYAGHSPVASRVLQVGPGDYCRIAFQPERGQRGYQVHYGGDREPRKPGPAWSAHVGLLLETRGWKACNLNQFDALRSAFDTAPPLGADYVPQIFHRENPFTAEPGPFLSRYQGQLHAPVPGKYRFYTSSQDASFVRIDDKPVVAAPGKHGPVHDARIQGEVELTAGNHALEYWHAASGEAACMVLAWQIPGTDKPSPLAPEVFGAEHVVTLPALKLEKHGKGQLPDFRVAVAGEVPLPDEPLPLLRVQFIEVAAPVVVSQAKFLWEFGDGQTAAVASPTHIYLHPGTYKVRCVVTHGADSLELVQQLVVAPKLIVHDPKAKPDELADYLPALHAYHAESLDAGGLLQLVKVYLTVDDAERAAVAGQAAFARRAEPLDDDTLWAIAQRAGPLLRDRLARPTDAVAFWKLAGKTLRRGEWKAACAVEAADLLLNDLAQADEADKLLEFARQRLASGSGEWPARLHRVLGDWHARHGQAAEARRAYEQAERAVASSRNVTERSAWRGAHSRSVEAFLREKQWDSARDELRRWQLTYPTDTLTGLLPLLWTRFELAREQWPQVALRAKDGLTVAPDSPYADQLLLLFAQAQVALEKPDAARAAYQSLLIDYPGSPLVETARKELARLPGGGAGAANTTREAAKSP